VTITKDIAERKATPMATGALDYFPDALAAVARLSRKANERHNPGQPMHWSKHKSSDHADCLVRHLVDRGIIDEEWGESHTVEVAWRALAMLQIEIEAGREGLTVADYLKQLATRARDIERFSYDPGR
jgi:hypothetical protein